MIDSVKRFEIEAKEVFAAFAMQISDRQGQRRNFLAAKGKSLKTTTSTAIFGTRGQTYDNFYAGILIIFKLCILRQVGTAWPFG